MIDTNKDAAGYHELGGANQQTPHHDRPSLATAGDLVARASMRLATVQHGNFNHTRLQLAAGGPETYYGQRQTVDAMWRLVAGSPHLFVGLSATPHDESSGLGHYVGPKDPPRFPGMPGRFHQRWLAQRILRQLRAFKPTHLLLRCNDVVGCSVLAWANKRRIPTIVLIAATFDPARKLNWRFCELANQPNVAFVANHNRVSTESLITCGLLPAKALAWDYIHATRPEQHAAKTLPTTGPLSVLFAGTVSRPKGVAEVVDGCRLARGSGLDIRLTVCGNGPLMDYVRMYQHEGWLEATGSISQQEVVERMRRSQVVVVPSQHCFPEGLPLVLYEGLATRTPTILSDHPVFQRYFENDRGVRFFAAESSRGMAAALQSLLLNPAAYARLSEQTEEVWNSLQCKTKFHHVVERIAAIWDITPLSESAGQPAETLLA